MSIFYMHTLLVLVIHPTSPPESSPLPSPCGVDCKFHRKRNPPFPNPIQLQTPLQKNNLPKPLRPALNLSRRSPKQRPPSMAAIPEPRRQGSLGADDPPRDSDGVGTGDEGLQFLGLGKAAGGVEGDDADAGFGADVGEAGDGAGAGGDEGLEGEVCGAAEAHEGGGLGGGVGGCGGG